MLVARAVARRRAGDEGSIAILAALTAPIVLLVIALALATLVWSSSENETQHAADEAAVQAAATALLTNLGSLELDPLASSAYPTVQSVAGSLGLPAPTNPTSRACGTLGDLTTAISGYVGSVDVQVQQLVQTVTQVSVPAVVATVLNLATTIPLPPPLNGLIPTTIPFPTTVPTTTMSPSPTTTTTTTASPSPLPVVIPPLVPFVDDLPDDCSAVSPLPVIPPVPASGEARTACAAAEAAMTDGAAPYSNRFYGGSGDSQPTCANGRIRTAVATGSPLVGLRTGTVDALTGGITPSLSSQIETVQDTLAPLGVRLDSVLPNALCPQVSVEVDQPVREPVYDRVSAPNGRATAQRVFKNAVIVPVYNGMGVASASGQVTASLGPVGTIDAAATANAFLPAVNLNPTLLEAQQQLLGVLDEVEASVARALDDAGVALTGLDGALEPVTVLSGGAVTAPQAPSVPDLGDLRLTQCLKNSVQQTFAPPGNEADAPTVEEVLANAEATGDPVTLIQVGVTCANTGPAGPAQTVSCLQAATGGAASAVTGLYDVPFFDVTPVLVRDVGDGNYTAVPVHASQASGAFRATLVRASTDDRYVPFTTPGGGASAPDCIPASSVPLPDGGVVVVPGVICASATATPSPSNPVPTSTPSLPVPLPTPSLPVPLPTLTSPAVALRGGGS